MSEPSGAGTSAGRARVLKRDALGRVELVRSGGVERVRRVAAGGRMPGSAFVARLLLERERRALARLDGLAGVPRLAGTETRARPPAAPAMLEREYLTGRALHEAEVLPRDFFEHLEVLVRAVHARGVCHNDLHKEQNVLVRPDGTPALVDFQLASEHPRGGRAFRARCGDDLRHVAKHRRRYTRDGRGPEGAGAAPVERPLRRSFAAAAWRRLVKPVYNLVTRSLGLADREARRSSSGPWPRWGAPLGTRDPRA